MISRRACVRWSGRWLAHGRGSARAFARALANPERVQERLLLKLLRRNAGSRYGRRFGFSSIRSFREYQARVPIVGYDDLREEIAAIARGVPGVLTEEPVLAMESTTGSTAATKLIPYTASLLREFRAALYPWMSDLYTRHPELRRGRAYWCITPVAAAEQRTPGGLPLGLQDDAAYFGAGSRFLRRLMLGSGALARIPDLETCRYVTLLHLLAAPDLRFVSVWHPSFLALLVEALQSHAERLLRDLERGALDGSQRLAQPLRGRVLRGLRPQPRRARELHARLCATGRLRPQDVWPALRVVSCWGSAAAEPHARELRTLFPHAALQPKGLLATEGVVSIPLAEEGGSALALTSHALEFVDEAAAGPPALAHELLDGRTYEVVLTTGGGLYRYATGDRVRVLGWRAATPLVEFVGRRNVSDLRGEKLHEGRAAEVLAAAFHEAGLRPAFAMLAPDGDQPPHYTLFVECRGGFEPAALARQVEERLLEGAHYSYSRRLGQLGPVRVFRIREGAARVYLERCAALGQRQGAVKPTPLHPRGGWAECFDGAYVDARDCGAALSQPA
jgi:hypothetical protein